MHKLDRYIGTSVFLAILSVLGIIVGLALLFAFIDELGDLSDSYGTLEAMIYVVLTLPRRAYEMLPMAALIGCLAIWRTRRFHTRGRGLAIAAVVINVLTTIIVIWMTMHGISMDDMYQAMLNMLAPGMGEIGRAHV